MYTVKIDISDWGSDESVTIETSDFDKIQIIQEFIEFQREYGWCADYELLVGDDEEEVDGIEEDEAEDDEPMTVSTYVITKIEE
jgi:hypothetical protein